MDLDLRVSRMCALCVFMLLQRSIAQARAMAPEVATFIESLIRIIAVVLFGFLAFHSQFQNHITTRMR